MTAKLIGSGTATYQVQDPYVQVTEGAFTQKECSLVTPGATGLPTERGQTTEDEWGGNLETAQKYICELLIKNQELRMALMDARGPEFDYERSIRF